MPELNRNTERSDELLFNDMTFNRHQELQAEFRKPGPDGLFQLGMIAEALPENAEGYRSLVHFADPYQGMTMDANGRMSGGADTPLTIVTFPSYASAEEVEKLRNRIIPMPETCEMMQALAEAREMNNILLIIGGTAMGKTFVVKTFVKALYGPQADPLDFYCNGQTDVSELHGMWVPKLSSEKERSAWRSFIESETGGGRMREIVDSMSSTKELPEDQRIASLSERLKDLAKEVGLSAGVSWEFSMGAVPKSFSACFDPELRRIVDFKEGGKGYPLHIQEVGLATPRVVNALLEIRGDNGALADSIQIWRNGGLPIYRGSESFVVMTTNPEEEAGYKERNELDKALLRGVLPLRMKENLSPFSVHLATERYFSYQSGNCPAEKPRGCVIPIYHYVDDIGRPLAAVVSAFHHSYTKAFKTGEGRGKSQTMVSSIDQIARLADYMLRFQVIDPKSGHPDLVETLKRGVERIYLRGLASEDKREEQRKVLNALVGGETLFARLGGLYRTPATKIEAAVKEIMKTLKVDGKGFSEELAAEVRRARIARSRAESNGLRDGLLGSQDVADSIKDLLKKRPNP
jgi:hypothetical protein